MSQQGGILATILAVRHWKLVTFHTHNISRCISSRLERTHSQSLRVYRSVWKERVTFWPDVWSRSWSSGVGLPLIIRPRFDWLSSFEKTWRLDIISSLFSFYLEQNSVVCAPLTTYGLFMIESCSLSQKHARAHTVQQETGGDVTKREKVWFCLQKSLFKQTNHQSVAEYLVYTWEQQNSDV